MIQPVRTCGFGSGVGTAAGAASATGAAATRAGAAASRLGRGAGSGSGSTALAGAGAAAGGSFRGSIASGNAGSGGNCSGTAEAVCTPPPGLTISVFTGTGRIGSVEPAAGRGAWTAAVAGSERTSVVLALASAKLDPALGAAGFGSAIFGSATLG